MVDHEITEREVGGRTTIDVSGLPETTFGHRGLLWWGTVAFMVIEGTTVAVLATAYLYLRLNAAEWPPRPASSPDLRIALVNLLVFLATIPAAWKAVNAAKRFDLGGVRRWLAIDLGLSAVATALRWAELESLNVRWNENAYGSIVWAMMASHTLLLVTDLLEGGTIAAIMFSGRAEPKHFSDVEDASLYQYFLVGTWVVLFAMIFLGPRVL